jgi:capsular polysaccharide biosynthesis protein
VVNIVQGMFLLVIMLVIATTIVNGILTFLNFKLYTELIKMRVNNGNQQPAHSDEQSQGAGRDLPADRGQPTGRNT